MLIENNGIGYEVNCSQSVFTKYSGQKTCEVFSYMAVREDGVYLYGFSSLQEKEMFLKLITVSGVGPKMGITVLSAFDLKDLAIKIASSDVKGLSSVKGLGKKTAERIILELREKIISDEDGDLTVPQKETVTDSKVNEDALIALMSLGLTKGEGIKALKLAEENGAKTLQELVSYAIRYAK